MSEELNKQVVRSRLVHKVQILGKVDPKQFYANCDLTICPSRLDGRPNVVIESLSMGVPVLASRVGGLPEMILEGKTGHLCQLSKIEEFAARIKFLMAHPEQYKQMSQNARQHALTEFDIHRSFQAYEELFEKLSPDMKLVGTQSPAG